jgi:predicted transcriptional regulator|tara:strand:+ start:352 stop:699 length:348 start_codon:yes stop_codon:yes gene_type:complete
MEKKPRGRPAHEPNAETKTLARTLSAVGVTYEDIASKLQISSDTLTKYYKTELDEGRIDANAQIARSLFEQAKTGNTSAQMFWLKTRAGWKETDRREIDGTIHLSWDEWVDDGND